VRFSILLLISLNVFADILFVDFNRSMSEIKAAKEAARIRGEKLITIPDYTNDDIRSISTSQYQVKLLEDQLDKLYKNYDSNLAKIKEVEDKIDVYEKDIESKAEKFDLKSIESKLKQLNSNNTKITSVVLSGHSGGRGVWGENSSSISFDNIIKSFNKYPKVFEEMSSVFTAACYSMTADNALKWTENFSSLEMCYGYAKVGPGRMTSAAGSTIKDGLIDESKIITAKTGKDVYNQLVNIENAKYTTASLFVPSCGYYADITSGKNGTKNLNEFLSCEKQAENLGTDYIELKKLYEKYRDALPGYEDPSKNDGTKKLRSFYNLYQQLPEKCYGKLGLPDFKSILGLIKFDHIKENYDIFYGGAKKRIDKLADWARLPKEMRMPKVENMSRAELFKYVEEFEKAEKKWKKQFPAWASSKMNYYQLALKYGNGMSYEDAKKSYSDMVHYKNRVKNVLLSFNCLRHETWIEGGMTKQTLQGPYKSCR
jgi:hypothetical protein